MSVRWSNKRQDSTAKKDVHSSTILPIVLEGTLKASISTCVIGETLQRIRTFPHRLAASESISLATATVISQSFRQVGVHWIGNFSSMSHLVNRTENVNRLPMFDRGRWRTPEANQVVFQQFTSLGQELIKWFLFPFNYLFEARRNSSFSRRTSLGRSEDISSLAWVRDLWRSLIFSIVRWE